MSSKKKNADFLRLTRVLTSNSRGFFAAQSRLKSSEFKIEYYCCSLNTNFSNCSFVKSTMRELQNNYAFIDIYLCVVFACIRYGQL